MAVRHGKRVLGLILASVATIAVPGCLSLGGKTTHVNQDPETVHRIAALEVRVRALEEMLSSPPVIREPLPRRIDTPGAQQLR